MFRLKATLSLFVVLNEALIWKVWRVFKLQMEKKHTGLQGSYKYDE